MWFWVGSGVALSVSLRFRVVLWRFGWFCGRPRWFYDVMWRCGVVLNGFVLVLGGSMRFCVVLRWFEVVQQHFRWF